MMGFGEKLINGCEYKIVGASYAGTPRNNTMMYISKKVEYLVENLINSRECLIFVEDNVLMDKNVIENNCIVFCKNPQLEYARVATEFINSIRKKDNNYRLTKGGYYLGENVSIGKNAFIEPNCVIGRDVIIGDNATILSGAVIKHAIIGNNFLCNENAVIGDYSFTMAEDENGNKFRIPSLGRVLIGDNVEIGACNDVAMGACGDTIIEDNVKLDGLVHIGHEAHIFKNSVITAGAIVAGFVEIGEESYLGINTSIKNRIHLGKNSMVGMGANVLKNVDEGAVVAGNPAKPLVR